MEWGSILLCALVVLYAAVGGYFAARPLRGKPSFAGLEALLHWVLKGGNYALAWLIISWLGTWLMADQPESWAYQLVRFNCMLAMVSLCLLAAKMMRILLAMRSCEPPDAV